MGTITETPVWAEEVYLIEETDEVLGGVDGISNRAAQQLANRTAYLNKNKESAIAGGENTQYFRGDKTWQTLNKSAVGLSNVNNTSDEDKPISKETKTALNAKEATIVAGTTAQYLRGDKTWDDFASSVRASVLTGMATNVSTAVLVTDTILTAIGKLQSQVSLRATLASPSLTGVPLAPTAAQTVNNTQVATTAYVRTAIAAVSAKPIGATEIQYPGKATPSALYGGTWVLVGLPAGVFFRIEGGNASAFGAGVQSDAIRNITGTTRFDGDRSNASASNSALFNTHVSNGEGFNRTGQGNAGITYGVSLDVSRTGIPTTDPVTGENRSINITIRVWERTA